MTLRLATAALLGLVLSGSAHAQLTLGRMTMAGGPALSLEVDGGSFELAEGRADVVRATPGAYLRVTSADTSGRSGQVEVVGLADGAIRRVYRLNGQVRPYDADAAALLAKGLGRLRGIELGWRGVPNGAPTSAWVTAALGRIARQTSPRERLGEYDELLGDPALPPAEFARVLRAAKPTADSIRHWPMMLRWMLMGSAQLPPRSQAVLVSELLRALPDTGQMELAQMLPRVLTMDDPAVAAAYYGTVPLEPRSDTPFLLRLVVLHDASLPATYMVGAIRSLAPLTERERVGMLLAVPAVCLRSPAVRAAYAQIMRGVTYDVDRLRLQVNLDRGAGAAGRGTPPPCVR